MEIPEGVIFLVVGVGILLGVLYVLGVFDSTPVAKKKGVRAIVQTTATDDRNNRTVFFTGDTLILSYVGTLASEQKTAYVKWRYASVPTDESEPLEWTSVVEATNEAAFRWRIPGLLVGRYVFHVSSLYDSKVSMSTDVVSIMPRLSASAPSDGTWKSDGYVEVGSSQLISYTVSDDRWIRPGYVKIEYALSAGNFNTWETSMEASDVKVDATNKTVTWVPSEDLLDQGVLKVRLSTTHLTDLVGRELSITIPTTVIVVESDQGASSFGSVTVSYKYETRTITLVYTDLAISQARVFYQLNDGDWAVLSVNQGEAGLTVTDGSVTVVYQHGESESGLMKFRLAVNTTTAAAIGDLTSDDMVACQITAGVFMSSEYGDLVVSPPTVLVYAADGSESSNSFSVEVYNYSSPDELNSMSNWSIGWVKDATATVENLKYGNMTLKAVRSGLVRPGVMSVALDYLDQGGELDGKTIPIWVRFRKNLLSLQYISNRTWILQRS